MAAGGDGEAADMTMKNNLLSQPMVMRPVIDQSRCNSCGICIRNCLAGALLEPSNASCAKCVKYCISIDVPCEPTKVMVLHDRCNGCGTCLTICPQEAIELRVFDKQSSNDG